MHSHSRNKCRFFFGSSGQSSNSVSIVKHLIVLDELHVARFKIHVEMNIGLFANLLKKIERCDLLFGKCRHARQVLR